MEKHYTHESKELNALLGKKVRVTLFNDKTITGILTRAEWKPEADIQALMTCPTCGTIYDIEDSFRFCPNCGALMDFEGKR